MRSGLDRAIRQARESPERQRCTGLGVASLRDAPTRRVFFRTNRRPGSWSRGRPDRGNRIVGKEATVSEKRQPRAARSRKGASASEADSRAAPRRPKEDAGRGASGAPSPGRRGHRERSTWALDIHLTAPGVGEGDAAHRIEATEPFAIRGMMWPTSDGEPVEVDVMIEELRAQVLVSEEDLPRLRRDLDSVRGSRPRRKPRPEAAKSEALKPERVQARAASATGRRSRDE